MADLFETERLIGDLLRMATVDSVDLVAGRCVLLVGDELKSGPLPWFVLAAGDTRAWSAPSVGEQGLLVCPEGDIAAGVFLRGVYSDAFPAPLSTDVEAVRFCDGSLVSYDAAASEMVLQLVGKVRLVAPEGLAIQADTTIAGDVAVTGKISASANITSSADVKAGAISLKSHKHGNVQSGGAQTGAAL